jgi:hypothetical protein
VEIAAEAIYTVAHVFTIFLQAGESPMERGLVVEVSIGTYTSTIVPSLIGTS